ncbi:MAG: pseudouridine synthase [Anaerolineae bacterium]
MEERLHKVLAQAGISSRRHAEEMILAGRVRVNGKVVETLGAKVDPERDTVEVDGQKVKLETKIYLALNKPRGYISDRDETGEHRTALDLVPNGERLFAAGRLDMDSEGLLLLTNDGELTFRLTHPRYEHEKEYLALVGGQPNAEALSQMKRGVTYQDTVLRADRAALAERKQPFGEAGRDQTWMRIVLHEGKKREIRHMCAALGHPVLRLVRVRIGPIEIGKLKLGQSRPLTAHEIHALRQTTSQLAPRISKRARIAYGRRQSPESKWSEAKEQPAARPLATGPKPKPRAAGHPAAPKFKARTESRPTGAKPKPRAEYHSTGAKPKPRTEYRPTGAKPKPRAEYHSTGAKPKPRTEYRPADPRRPAAQPGTPAPKGKRPARPARQQQTGRRNNPRRARQ